jgi:integral membrane protein (TIGR01906 family)
VRTNPARVAASLLTAVATAILILAVAVLAFLNPAWVAVAQERSDVTAWTGFTPAEVSAATNAILVDLVLGAGDFDVTVGGAPVLDVVERGHMRDVRGVFAGFAVVTLLSLAWLVVARARLPIDVWAAVRRGAIGLVVVLVVAAAAAALAFDAAFAVFHGLLFSGGNWAFDPATSRLVQLFPMQFWFETTIALGAVAIVLALLAAAIAGRRREPAAVRPVGVEHVVGASR